jgi:hypothetical protein
VLGLGPRLRVVLLRTNGEQLGEIAALLGRRTIHPPRIARAFPFDRARWMGWVAGRGV